MATVGLYNDRHNSPIVKFSGEDVMKILETIAWADAAREIAHDAREQHMKTLERRIQEALKKNPMNDTEYLNMAKAALLRDIGNIY